MSDARLWRDKEWVRERWFSPTPVTEIADEAGCSDAIVHEWATDEFGFPPKTEAISPDCPYRDEEWLWDRWDSSQTVEEIAEEASAAFITIMRWAEKHGFPEKESLRPWFDSERLREMYHEHGMTIAEIAAEMGCSETAVRAAMDRHKIERRLPWEHLEKDRAARFKNNRSREQVGFTVDGQTHYYSVHRMLAIAIWGLDEVAGKVVHHKNGIGWDNRPDNLELIDSQAEHARLHNEDRERDDLGRYI